MQGERHNNALPNSSHRLTTWRNKAAPMETSRERRRTFRRHSHQILLLCCCHLHSSKVTVLFPSRQEQGYSAAVTYIAARLLYCCHSDRSKVTVLLSLRQEQGYPTVTIQIAAGLLYCCHLNRSWICDVSQHGRKLVTVVSIAYFQSSGASV